MKHAAKIQKNCISYANISCNLFNGIVRCFYLDCLEVSKKSTIFARRF